MYKLLMAIGIVIMFAVGIVIGIQFMVASAEDKAKVKEALIPYIVGCIVIFGAFTIWSIAVNLGQDMESTGTILTDEDRESLANPDKDFSGHRTEWRTLHNVIIVINFF